jgi:hypothetical protein
MNTFEKNSKTMRKSFILISILLAQALPEITRGQNFVNGNFESWISASFKDPVNWSNSNIYLLSAVDTNVTRVPGQSGYAVRLQSKPLIASAFISNSQLNALAGEGGEPYTGQPQGISLRARYNIASGDTARIFFIFKNSGNVIMQESFGIAGVHTNGFDTLSFSFSGTFSVSPDSVVVLITSSDIFSPLPGNSFLEIDELSFTGSSQQLLNHGFDNWQVVTVEEPVAWLVLDSVKKTTDSYSGNYAARINTYTADWGPSGSELIASFGAITTNTLMLTGYYKYITPGLDSPAVTLEFVGDNLDSTDVVIDVIHYHLPPVSSYTLFSIPFNSDSLLHIHSVNVRFNSSSNAIMPVLGSSFYVDALQLGSTMSINECQEFPTPVQLYPNPTGKTIYWSEDFGYVKKVLVYDMKGNMVHCTDQPMSNSADIHDLPGGRYIIYVEGSKSHHVQSIIKK